LCRQSLRNAVCSSRSETTDLVPLELESPDIDIQVLIKTPFGAVGAHSWGATPAPKGDITHGILSAEHAFGFAYKARPMTEIIARVEASQHLALYRQGGAV
jgi:hypothetical protein